MLVLLDDLFATVLVRLGQVPFLEGLLLAWFSQFRGALVEVVR